MRVLPLARLDPDRELVLGRGQRAGGVFGEDAGRVVGAVEVDHGLAADGRLHVEEASGSVRVDAVGAIPEDHEIVRFAALENRVQTVGPAAVLEDEGARGRLRVVLTEHVRDRDPFRGSVGLEPGLDPPARCDRKIVQTVEAPAGGARAVLDANAEPIAAADQVEEEASEAQPRRLSVRVRCEHQRPVDGVPVGRQCGSRQRTQRRPVPDENDRAEARGRGVRQDDAVSGLAAEGIVALVEPVEPDDRQPSVFGAEPGDPLRAPGLDLGAICGARGLGRRREHQQEDGEDPHPRTRPSPARRVRWIARGWPSRRRGCRRGTGPFRTPRRRRA